jgi:hypothetical protein
MARPFREPLRQAVGAPLATANHFTCPPGLVAAEAHVCAGTASPTSAPGPQVYAIEPRQRSDEPLLRCATVGGALSARHVSRRMPCRVPRVRCTLPALPRRNAEGPLRSWMQSPICARFAEARGAPWAGLPTGCERLPHALPHALPAPRSSSRPLRCAAQLGRVVHSRMLPPRRPRRAARRHARRLRLHDRAGVRSGACRGDAG